MFAEMRRKDREIGRNDIDVILEKAEFGIVSSIDVNGYPYSVPFNFVAVENKIYIHCSTSEGSNMKNIRNNPKVCFAVVGETEVMPDKFATLYESVVAFGLAHEVEEERKRPILIQLLKKYSPDYMESGFQYIDKLIDKTAVIEITVEHIAGKARRKTTKSNLEFFGHKDKLE
jgi:nitroimidazol reductase NimA-like FMN-containing flavoprotein (pyridoxamine 5'-phosphate oxidase superfamily)